MTEVLRMGFGVIAVELIVVIIYLRRLVNFFGGLGYIMDFEDDDDDET